MYDYLKAYVPNNFLCLLGKAQSIPIWFHDKGIVEKEERHFARSNFANRSIFFLKNPNCQITDDFSKF